MAKLILIRHGQSLWNEKGLWTGWTDIELSEKGKEEARHAGEKIKDFSVDKVYMSKLKRAKQTWDEIAKFFPQDLSVIESENLNERNYGDYTGKNKWELKEQFGEEKFQNIRRGWDTAIPHGETLKDVYHRVVPYLQSEIVPHLTKGENILICAHGNSLRAIVKYLDNISDEEISNIELKTGEIYIYTFDENGKVLEKEIISEHLQ